MAIANPLRRLINGSAILSAAVSSGEIQVIYAQEPEIDAEKLYRTWTAEVFVSDPEDTSLIDQALKKLNVDTKKTRKGFIQVVYQQLITAAERTRLSNEEKKAADEVREAARLEKEAITASVIAELQQQINDLREELELLQLVKAKGSPGPKGDPGKQGPAGRDGKDLLATDASLADLQDVSDEEPTQGQVLTWDSISGLWEPKAPPMSGVSIGGGGGGGGGTGGINGITVGTYGPDAQDVGTEVTTIRFDSASGFSVVEGPDGATEARISLNSTFKYWKIAGQPDVVAEGEDTMHLIAGPGVSLTTTPTEPKSITISAEGLGLEFWTEDPSGGLVPSADNVQSIGSLSNQIKDVYIGTGAVYFDGVVLEKDEDDRLVFNGNVLAYQSTGSLTQWEETTGGTLRPLSDNQDDLGDASHHVRKIYLGGKRLEINDAGELTVNGVPLAFSRGSVFSQALGIDGGEVIETPTTSDMADGGEIVNVGQAAPVESLEVVHLQADGGTLT